MRKSLNDNSLGLGSKTMRQEISSSRIWNGGMSGHGVGPSRPGRHLLSLGLRPGDRLCCCDAVFNPHDFGSALCLFSSNINSNEGWGSQRPHSPATLPPNSFSLCFSRFLETRVCTIVPGTGRLALELRMKLTGPQQSLY